VNVDRGASQEYLVSQIFNRDVIEEAELRQWSHDERQHLARLLATIDEPHVMRDAASHRRRRLSLLVFMGGCVVLAVWIALLMVTLPKNYHSHHWRGAWVGFDFALLGAFAATAWASWRERQVLIILLTITGTLLLCDAWFDLLLDLGTHEIWTSVFSAAVAEIPLATMMFIAARRLMRMSVGVVMQLEGISAPVPALWHIPLFAEGLQAVLPARYRDEARDPDPSDADPREPASAE
jgi:hypothetical protein